MLGTCLVVLVMVLACVTDVLGQRQIPCHLEKFVVREQDVDWEKVGRHLNPHEIVIFPPELHVWTCIGSCPYRNKNSLFFTEHARILSAIHKSSKSSRTSRRPLCAPAKLKSMNINVFNNRTSRLRRVRLKHASATACQCS